MCDGTSVETTATALALAEQYGCLKLEARCVELITANLDAVMVTEGYKASDSVRYCVEYL
jgi:speckle-type POZ protein